MAVWRAFFCLSLMFGAKAWAWDMNFCKTYHSCRRAYLKAARTAAERDETITTRLFRIESEVHSQLYVNYTYAPALEEQRSLLFLMSGVHGVEGYFGSVVQQYFLREILPKIDRRKVGVLLVHGLNPFGFRYDRRVTENNIDLNRNFSTTRRLFARRNPIYDSVEHVVGSTSWVSIGFSAWTRFTASMGLKATVHGEEKLLMGIGAGQYEYPFGLYYGGNAFEPHKKLIDQLLTDVAASYDQTLLLDLHTGHGQYGKLHLSLSPPLDDRMRAATEDIFSGYAIAWDGADHKVPDARGRVATYICKVLAKRGKLCVPMVVQFGTQKSQLATSQFETLFVLAQENQLHWYGAEDQLAAKVTRARFRDLFFPDDPSWRKAVGEQIEAFLPDVVRRFSPHD